MNGAERLLTALLAAALPLASAPAGAAAVVVVDKSVLPRVTTAHATHRLSLQVHTFRGTRWEAGDITKAVSAAAPLLAQCGVALTNTELLTLETPRRFHFYHTAVSRELLHAFEIAKPAIFFVEDTRNDPAFDAEAIGISNAKTRPELANTVWVAYGAKDLPQALAHEIVHVLSDSGEHSNEPGNLMQADTSPQNTRLNRQQCELLRARGEANGLLQRVKRN